MKKKWEKFCPEWLYKIVVCITVYDYVVRDIGLFISEKKYSDFFKSKYDDLSAEAINEGVTLYLQFLGELKKQRILLCFSTITCTIL